MHPKTIISLSELRDLNDKIVLETAWAVPVNFIISGDLDLLVLKKFQGITIVTAASFLEKSY